MSIRYRCGACNTLVTTLGQWQANVHQTQGAVLTYFRQTYLINALETILDELKGDAWVLTPGLPRLTGIVPRSRFQTMAEVEEVAARDTSNLELRERTCV
jgi:hypothetical protein